MNEISDTCLPIRAEYLLINILETTLFRGLFKETDGPRIIDKLNQATIRTIRDDGIGLNPNLNVLFLENLMEKVDELHSHILLSQIISTLDHKTFNLMTSDISIN